MPGSTAASAFHKGAPASPVVLSLPLMTGTGWPDERCRWSDRSAHRALLQATLELFASLNPVAGQSAGSKEWVRMQAGLLGTIWPPILMFKQACTDLAPEK